MASKKKKPVRYPRKFRQKLERMAEQREAAKPNDRDPGPTLWSEMIKNRVEFMHGKIDDSADDPAYWKLHMSHTLKRNRTRERKHKPLQVEPPWARNWKPPGSDD